MTDAIRIEEATELSEELAGAMAALVPQLSRSSPPPSVAEVEEIVSSRTCHLLLARDTSGKIVGC